MSNQLTLGSLFAGIGGFDLGFERAGFKTTWTCEIDQKAQAVLRYRFPDAAHHDDVTQVGAYNLGPVDVVTFGSPCQDLSVAGKRAGLAGGRSGLFHEAVRIIRELRAAHGKPDIAIWENVPGAFSSNGGRDFAVVVQEMVNLGARDVAWRVLDSRFFGVPQRRRRCFLVADFGGERAEQVLAFRESGGWDTQKSRASRKRTAQGAGEGAAGGCGYRMRAFGDYADDDTASAMKQCDHKAATDLVAITMADVAGPLDASYYKDTGSRAGQEREFVAVAPIPYDLLQVTAPVNRQNREPSDPCHTLARDNAAHAAVVVPQPIAFHPTQDPISSTEQAHSLSCGSKSVTASVAVAYGFYSNEGSHGMGDNREVAPSLKIGGGSAPPAVAYGIDEEQNAMREGFGCLKARMEGGGFEGTVALLPEVSGTLGGGSGQRGWSSDLDRSGAFIPVLAPTLTAANDPSRSPQSSEITQQVAAIFDSYNQTANRVSFPLRVGTGNGTGDEIPKVFGQQSAVVRRLTPVECCRLQGFPDDWNAEGIDKTGKRIVMADSSRYKQLGNAVTVTVAEWIARRVASALR